MLFIVLATLAGAPLLYALRADDRGTRLPLAAPPPPATTSEPSKPYVVQIVGENFRWRFQVLEPNESKVSNVLQLPAGAHVQWRLTSADYIYAFRIPELNINMMAVPRITSTAVTPDTTPLSVDLLVDPLCNFRLYHDEWMGRVEIGTVTAHSASTEDRS